MNEEPEVYNVWMEIHETECVFDSYMFEGNDLDSMQVWCEICQCDICREKKKCLRFTWQPASLFTVCACKGCFNKLIGE